jgi:phosphohistidine swiveling domain-containing protein
VVVEHGSLLSHAAIVAREFGLPAMVVPDVMSSVRTGDTARLDTAAYALLMVRSNSPPC